MVTSEDRLHQARALGEEIARHARARDNKALLSIDSDSAAMDLLAGLPAREFGPAQAHLNAARIWKTKQNQRADRKFDAAQKELDELDIPLARGILRKIDPAVLEEPQLARYDDLLLAIEARGMELEEIQSQLPELPPEQPKKKFWPR